jgi:hypothetical protein
MESRGDRGIWVGRNRKSNQHQTPKTWDLTERKWMLGQLKSLCTVIVFDDIFFETSPSRCR